MAEDKEVKRLTYFKGQFLQEEDFNAEQAYHMRMRRLHNAKLHTWGVVEGLEVTQASGTNSIVVAPGIALDKNGQEIVLPIPGSASVPITGVTKGDVFITISYGEADDPVDAYTTAGVTGKFKKKTERPLPPKVEAAPPAGGSLAVLLAKVSVDGGNIVAIDNNARRLVTSSAFASTDLEVRSLKWGNNSRLQADQGGSIELGGDPNTPGTGTPYIDFHFSGKTQDFSARIINDADKRLKIETSTLITSANVGIGTATPQRRLQVGEDVSGLGIDPSDVSPNAAYMRFGDNTGWKLHFARSREGSGAAVNAGQAGILMTLKDNGNFGIGTNDPKAKLDVADTTLNTTKSILARLNEGNTEGTTDVGTTLAVKAYNTQPIEAKSFALEHRFYGLLNNAINFYRGSGKQGGHIAFGTGDGTENVTIDRSGNVGIGTAAGATPAAKLQVTGGAIMPAIGNNEQSGIQFPNDPGVGAGDRAFIRYYVESGTETTKLMIGVANDADDAIGFTQFGAERMTIFGGNVGIGVTTPAETLEVNGRIKSGALSIGPWPASTAYMFVGTNALDQTVAGNYALLQSSAGGDKGVTFLNSPETIRFRIGNLDKMTLTKTGNIGIGTITPTEALLHVAATQGIRQNYLYLSGAAAGSSFSYNAHRNESNNGWVFPDPARVAVTLEMDDANGGGRFDVYSTTKAAKTQWRRCFGMDGETGDFVMLGNLGTHGRAATPLKVGWGGGVRTWDVEAEGTIWSNNGVVGNPHDLAENYLSDMDLAPGDVLCLDRDRDRIVQSEKPNDMLLIGVVSTAPGVLLNGMHGEEDSVPGMLPYPVALCGRVPCKVTDENGPIERGDLLTTSSTPGHAMKATPVRVEGIDVYRPGTVIGKALERHKFGKGMIEVFVALR